MKGFTHTTLQSSSFIQDVEIKLLNRFGRAAWLGARIILRQVSPESEAIFDFIVQLYHLCSGNWERLCVELKVSDNELTKFLEFAAVFLGNIGNFYVC